MICFAEVLKCCKQISLLPSVSKAQTEHLREELTNRLSYKCQVREYPAFTSFSSPIKKLPKREA